MTKTEISEITAEKVVEGAYKILKQRLQHIPFNERAVTIVNRTYDSCEGQQTVHMEYGEAHLFSAKGTHFALALGRRSGSGRIGPYNCTDIACIGLTLPRPSGLLGKMFGPSHKTLTEDVCGETRDAFHDGNYFRNTIVLAREDGRLQFTQDEYPIGRGPDLRTVRPKRYVKQFGGFHMQLRNSVARRMWPRLQVLMTQAARFYDRGREGIILYRPKATTKLADAISTALERYSE